MAEVFLARRRGPGGVEKRLAIKRIRRERASDPRLLSMFVDEARLSMTMVHKNIVPMFDFGRAGDELFLVMEYVDGADLGAALKGARRISLPLAPEVAAFIAMEACQALDYAHTMSGESSLGRVVIHRDVNPRNVLLSYAGEVKLVDFGVATTETDLGQAGRVRGTPAYMAPEQARAEAVDARADVFSVGLLLWESLVGKRAYGRDSLEETLTAARNGDVPPLPESVPERLREIVARATSGDREQRHASARELQVDLDRYIVAARAANPGAPPLSHRLSSWLRQVCPPDGEEGSLPARGQTPDVPVVTYLDDGAAELERVLTSSTGTATARSIAETVAEVSTDGETAADAPSSTAPRGTESDRRRVGTERSSRLLLAVLLLGALLAIGATRLFSGSTKPSTATATFDAGVTDKGVATGRRAAVAPSDAGTSELTGPDAGRATAGARFPGGGRDSAGAPTPHAGNRGEAARATAQRDARAGRSTADAGAHLETGMIRVSSSPWASVAVEGQKAGCAETPCTLTLAPGVYTLILRNPPGGLEKTVEVRVVSGETTDVIENLTR